MNGILWASLGAVVGLALSLLYLRRRQGLAVTARPGAGSATRVEAKSRPPGGFHGVTLKPCLIACEAVEAVAGKRFLSREAPALPLAGCNQPRCDCTYGHLSDRRDGGNRRSGWDTFGAFAEKLAKGNRRDEDSDRRDSN